MVDQILRRRRAELSKKWEEREQRLKDIRAKEKRQEERASKKRRLAEPSSRGTTKNVDEEAEFLLDSSAEGDGVDESDPLSWFSKETRAMIEKVGLAGSKAKGADEEELEEDIKVNKPEHHPILKLLSSTPADFPRFFTHHERILNSRSLYRN